MKPKVTIGICVRNCEDFVEETTDSIINQDFPHKLLEVIFVDDGSKDGTLSIIKRCVPKIDMPVKIFHHKWKGLGASRNVVVDNTKGDYIIWIDGDMVLSRDYVRKLVEFVEQHHEIGIAKGKQALKPCANMLGTLESYSRHCKMISYDPKRAPRKALGVGGSIYRTDAIRQVGGFDENLRGYCEDFDIEIRIRTAGWSIGVTNAEYLDYERRGVAWRSLWSRYYLRGYFTHYFLNKHRGFLKHTRTFPPAAFVLGLLHANILYKLLNEKKVFLLPFQYLFKMWAWYYGYIKSHPDSRADEHKRHP